MEVWSWAGSTAAVQAPLRGGRDVGVVRRAGMKVVGRLKCVRYSMCRVMVIISGEGNTPETKYSFW